MVKYIGFYVYHRPYKLWFPVIAHYTATPGKLHLVPRDFEDTVTGDHSK